MKDIGEGTIRRIDWTELTPIVLLLRIFNTALGVRVLVLALLGLWSAKLINYFAGIVQHTSQPNREGLLRINIPFDLFHTAYLDSIVSVQESSLKLCCGIGIFLIWAICGGLICRLVAFRLTIDEAEPTKKLFLFLRKRGISLFSPILLLAAGIFCCYLPLVIAKCLMFLPVLDYITIILFPIPLFFTFLTVLLSLGLAAGWMLLFAAVSVDGSDGFDAISRMFSYVFQRPLHYLVYWIFSAILGWLGFVLVQLLAFATVQLCWNMLAWNFIRVPVRVEFWLSLVESIPIAYLFTWFWTSSVAIYLLLRRSVDATPFDEVYRLEPPKVRTLPAIKKDAQDAPEIVSTEKT